MNYIIISPVKDEENFIEQTLDSVVQQTLKPSTWVIVDDGSTDRTPDIVQRYADSHSFIKLIRNTKRTARQTGTAEVLAFNVGYESCRNTSYDFVVKLDGDLSFAADYFERLLLRFRQNPKLGIASGIYMELKNSKWEEIRMPTYHAAGASKVLRKACFEEIGGFISKRGWDTVDEIRAMARGWETTHYPELKMRHLKPEGTGMGLLRTNYMQGEIYYRTKGSKFFLALKLLNRMAHRPLLIGGLAMTWGYLSAMVRRMEPLVSKAEGRYYQALLNGRILDKIRKVSSAK